MTTTLQSPMTILRTEHDRLARIRIAATAAYVRLMAVGTPDEIEAARTHGIRVEAVERAAYHRLVQAREQDAA